jgi:hypothetical protein
MDGLTSIIAAITTLAAAIIPIVYRGKIKDLNLKIATLNQRVNSFNDLVDTLETVFFLIFIDDLDNALSIIKKKNGNILYDLLKIRLYELTNEDSKSIDLMKTYSTSEEKSYLKKAYTGKLFYNILDFKIASLYFHDAFKSKAELQIKKMYCESLYFDHNIELFKQLAVDLIDKKGLDNFNEIMTSINNAMNEAEVSKKTNVIFKVFNDDLFFYHIEKGDFNIALNILNEYLQETTKKTDTFIINFGYLMLSSGEYNKIPVELKYYLKNSESQAIQHILSLIGHSYFLSHKYILAQKYYKKAMEMRYNELARHNYYTCRIYEIFLNEDIAKISESLKLLHNQILDCRELTMFIEKYNQIKKKSSFNHFTELFIKFDYKKYESIIRYKFFTGLSTNKINTQIE